MLYSRVRVHLRCPRYSGSRRYSARYVRTTLIPSVPSDPTGALWRAPGTIEGGPVLLYTELRARFSSDCLPSVIAWHPADTIAHQSPPNHGVQGRFSEKAGGARRREGVVRGG